MRSRSAGTARRLLVLAACVSLALVAAPSAAAAADVPTSNPFYGWIERLYQQNVTTGCGTNASGQLIYCPGEFVPRQQMAAFLIRAFR